MEFVIILDVQFSLILFKRCFHLLFRKINREKGYICNVCVGGRGGGGGSVCGPVLNFFYRF
jgi:hypothetical protein